MTVRVPAPTTTASPSARATVAATSTPDASIVIVTYGTGPIVVDTIVSIADSLADSDLEVEVIVVDNPHPTRTDRSFVELSLFTTGVRVVRAESNVGFGGGCELGALFATAPVLVFLNPDVTVAAGWLEALTDTLRSESMPSIVAPVLVNTDGTVQEVGQTIDHLGETTPCLTASAERFVRVDYSSAACWVMTRDEHERVGGFDPDYHPAYFEDVDLALRARSMGGTCVVDTSVEVVHHHGSGTPDAPDPAFAQRDVLLAKWPRLRWTPPTAG